MFYFGFNRGVEHGYPGQCHHGTHWEIGHASAERSARSLPRRKQACSKQCSSVGRERKVPSVAVISRSRNTGFGVPRGLENERKLASKCTDLSRTAPFDKCCQINLFSPKKREKRSKNEGREGNRTGFCLRESLLMMINM